MSGPGEPRFGAWEEWSARAYLDEYYRHVCPDERFLLEFLVEAARRLPAVPLALDYGCGPTVHRLFPLVGRVREVHLAEFLPDNREAVEAWRRGDPGAHDWTPFVRATLELEGAPAGEEAVRGREEAARSLLTELLPTDVRDADPLGPERRGLYPLVTTHYCADGITADREEWRGYMRNIASLVRPGGVLVASIITGDRYRVGTVDFPSAGLSASDLLAAMAEQDFVNIDLRERRVADRTEQGYTGVVFAAGVRAGGEGSDA